MAAMKWKIKYKGHTFFRNEDGYYRNGQTTFHRYKYEIKYGSIFPCFQLHHRDGDKVNNRLSNLEMLTPQEHAEVHKSMRREKMFERQIDLDFYL